MRRWSSSQGGNLIMGFLKSLKLVLALVAFVIFSQAALTQAADAPLPIADKDAHMGVFSCGGSTCHGSVQPWPNSNVLQNEFVTWQRQDKHAKAYQVLLNARSKRIAKNLGLKDAHTAKMCLDCHADNVPKNRRHRTFQISDGVTCEACHGGAGRWIGTHLTANAKHSENLKNGLYPTTDPVARAELCLSCHLGHESRPMTHRIMGAGHPRLSFELDTFTAIQPAHFRVDADYRKRKPSSNGVKIWAIGQAKAFDGILKTLLDAKRGRDGVLPEPVLLSCFSCHTSMRDLKWEARASNGLPPGVMRLNDSNLIMMQVIADRVDPALAKTLREQSVAVHRAMLVSLEELNTRAAALRATVGTLINRFAKHRFGRDDMKALFDGVVATGMKGEFVDVIAAEQATMALGAIINAMRDTGSVSKDQFAALDTAHRGVLVTVDKDEAYQHGPFLAALRKLQQALPR
jgi:hypothetical protein